MLKFKEKKLVEVNNTQSFYCKSVAWMAKKAVEWTVFQNL
jgi:hypothetical protein